MPGESDVPDSAGPELVGRDDDGTTAAEGCQRSSPTQGHDHGEDSLVIVWAPLTVVTWTVLPALALALAVAVTAALPEEVEPVVHGR